MVEAANAATMAVPAAVFLGWRQRLGRRPCAWAPEEMAFAASVTASVAYHAACAAGQPASALMWADVACMHALALSAGAAAFRRAATPVPTAWVLACVPASAGAALSRRASLRVAAIAAAIAPPVMLHAPRGAAARGVAWGAAGACLFGLARSGRRLRAAHALFHVALGPLVSYVCQACMRRRR